MRDPGIVRNRLKIDSTVTNAAAFLKVQREFGSFDRFLWEFVGGSAAQPGLRKTLSKELKRRGFRFVGTTICYAFMQAVGIVNDHTTDCFRFRKSAAMLDSQVLAFALVAALMTMLPGADTLLVVRNSLRGGRHDGFLTVAGICSGLFVHALLSALGCRSFWRIRPQPSRR